MSIFSVDFGLAMTYIGLKFFENDVGQVITVNREQFILIIINFFWSKMIDLDIHDMLPLQDGAMFLTGQAILDILHERFKKTHVKVIYTNY